MPAKQIANPNQVFGQVDGTGLPYGEGNEQVLIEVVNNSGGALQQGDVVIWAAAANEGRRVTTTTTANDARVAGVISRTGDSSIDGVSIPAGATCFLCVGGVARVNIGGQTVAALGILGTFTDAGEADDTATLNGTVLGVALEASTAVDVNGCILAKITLS
jgi:hypothetical protein